LVTNEAFALSAGDVKQAAARIAGRVHRTPVLTSRSVNAEAGCEVFFKCENLQRAGSFKARGAMNSVFALPEEVRRHGVVAFSSGNHAQAVALAAQEAGVAATIVMPSDAPRVKMNATRARGARVIEYDRATEDREAIGRKVAEETGASLIPPFDAVNTIAGQGTSVLELLEEVPDLDAIVVCTGGGGYLAGSCLVAKEHNAAIRMFGAEPELGNDWHLSFQRNERVHIALPKTLADGLMTQQPGKLTWPIVRALAESILLVSEEEIVETMFFLMDRLKMVIEPSGAVAAATVLKSKLPPGVKRVGVTISGGNVDLDLLAKLRG
jgi:threo-3-hydroxy-L-aspartate ammonia-lyase